MEDCMLKSTKIKQETVSKSEGSCEFEQSSSYDYNDDNALEIKNETEIGLTANRDLCEYKYDSVKKETEEKKCNCKEIKVEPKQEIEEEYYGGQYDVGPVFFKQETDDTKSYLESDDDKKESLPFISQAKSLHDDKQSSSKDILMALRNDNYGLLNEYVTKDFFFMEIAILL